MASTTRYTLNDSAYTLVADGLENVAIQLLTAGAVRVHVGTSLPAAGTDDFVPMVDQPISFSGLAGTDKVYARAGDGSSVDIVVVAG